jgi:hypothetical protein
MDNDRMGITIMMMMMAKLPTTGTRRPKYYLSLPVIMRTRSETHDRREKKVELYTSPTSSNFYVSSQLLHEFLLNVIKVTALPTAL